MEREKKKVGGRDEEEEKAGERKGEERESGRIILFYIFPRLFGSLTTTVNMAISV